MSHPSSEFISPYSSIGQLNTDPDFEYPFIPAEKRVYGQCNTAGLLKPGHLLVVTLPQNVCYQVDPKSGEFTYLFELNWYKGSFLWCVACDKFGDIYCTMSGLASPPPITNSTFGTWGAIVKVNHRKPSVKALAESKDIVDPYGIQIINDTSLLVSDFGNFGGSGSVYTIDKYSGAFELVANGGRLKEPTSAFMDIDGNIFVANGDQDDQDGEVVKLDVNRKQSVVVPREGHRAGALLGVIPGHNDDHIIAVRNEWDHRMNTKIQLVNKLTLESTTLLSANPNERKFFNTVPVCHNGNLWVAECVQKEILCFDVEKRKITKRIDLSKVMGGYRGMKNSFDAVPCIAVVPNLI